ncbi:hypothetical protein JG688_00015531 [Phytophthora aleatoria]|uniref:Uncharacterized protein n=1 Tax=Phytophthora aleatoria TaxID=2496075 RepID=A0A8J5IJU0_9STRA|nr:hypothetical protein JG688_00015531 [Phytophthora aleatoria]
MSCQSDRTIPVTSTRARVRHAFDVCPAVGILRSTQQSATTCGLLFPVTVNYTLKRIIAARMRTIVKDNQVDTIHCLIEFKL